MRTWLLAVSALTLVALTSPITAGEKRSSALAVRVTVVRSCSVNTDSALQNGGVSCGTRFGPPVMSTNSTISVTVPVVGAAAPAALVETNAVARNQPNPQSEGREVQTARQADASPQRVSETVTQAPADTTSGPSETVTIRVMTVNF
jgi:hypothetical protein